MPGVNAPARPDAPPSPADVRAWAARALDDATARTRLDAWLETQDATTRVTWALDHLPGTAVLSTSFGAQAAVLLHLVTQIRPDLPVLFVDTGYLFPETYRFADQLSERLSLKLHVVQAEQSAAWFEARHGQLWTQGRPGIERYNQLRKVEPMQRALDALGVGLWIAGLRRVQAQSRADRRVLERAGPRLKLHPIVDWSDRDVGRYLARHGLPYHPLWEQGYVSIGDVHSTRPLHAVDEPEATRFFGLKRECGLHE